MRFHGGPTRRLMISGATAITMVVALLATPPLIGAAAADTPTPRTWIVQAGEESPDHAIQGMAFLPSDIYIDQGDSITWTANSAEPHTVTFLADQTATTPPPFTLPDDLTPTPTPNPPPLVYHSGTYYNSGLLADLSPGLPISANYSLTFPDTGDFTYFCLLHGAMMKGTVHVHHAGARYPYSQRDYNKQARSTTNSIVRDGKALANSTRKLVDRHTVAMGADDGTAMVMRFIRRTVEVHVGEQVTFKNLGMAAPHTVTFGTDPANPFSPPSGDPTQFSGGDLNSGIVPPNGGQFTVTFTKAGTYHYFCALHDYMGMVGTVIVGGVDRHDQPEQ